MGHIRFLSFSLVVLSGTAAQSADDTNSSPSIHRVPDPASGHSAITFLLMPANNALREELDIATSQLDELRNIEETYQKRSNTIMSSWIVRSGQPVRQHSEMMTELRNAQKQLFKDLADILREEQFRRLRQIEFQRTTQFNSLVPLSWNVVMTELGLSPDEQTGFVQEVKTRSEALKKMNIDLPRRVPDEIARLVTPEQREQLEELDFQIRVAREAHLPLLSKTVATAIGLTEEKQAELKEAYAREYEVLLHERDRVCYEALDELLETLSPEQQRRYHLLVGRRFDKWF